MAVHLHVRSSYSLLQSTITIEALVKKSKELGFKAVSLVDYKVMYGTVEFFNACKKYDIKPIIGLEFKIEIGEEAFPFILLAKNIGGYKNLIKLSSILSNKDFIDIETLKVYKEDCVLIAYGEAGYLEEAIIKEDTSEISEKLDVLLDNFKDFYVAISYNDSAFFKSRNKILKEVCIQKNIKTLALNKIYYLNKEDDYLYKVMQAIDANMLIDDKRLTQLKGRHLRSISEMEALYDKDDLEATDYIASICNVTLDIEKTSLPKFEVAKDVSSKKYLSDLCKVGLKKRFNNKSIPQEYISRLEYELNVIMGMHYEDYFLIVFDFIRFARNHDIYVGPGRGSAAGSLVSYCLGITHVDPIKYNLLFERFLNPERISMPDIDVDFPDNKREEVINYVREKYGNKHIANILTFNTLKAKQVLRDVGKTLNISLKDLDLISKSVPKKLNITLLEAYQYEKFKRIIDSNDTFKRMFQVALKLEGLPRHTSIHAAGIVMSSLPLDRVIPIIENQGTYTTQFTMEYLEQFGLIKMDFLGLKNLTIIDEIVNKIKINESSFDIMKIPLDDKKTFDLLKDVDTNGIFQLDSDGMKNLIRKLQPSSFLDIVAAIALFRPGPMANIPLYLERKNNPSKIEYPHELLVPILQETYGIMIYQEQIMSIVKVMANFSLAKADILRKAISKKNEKELKKLEDDFIEGCLKNKHSRDLAKRMFDLIFKFAGYGFNKAHSVAYGLLAYQLAFLKANYPLEFYCSLLNSVNHDQDKVGQYILQLRAKQILILRPDVTYSGFNFEIKDSKIIYPLSAIKNVTSNAVAQILVARSQKPFEDYLDFIARLNGQRVNKKIFESLINAGALDSFYSNRKSLLLTLDNAISYSELIKVENNDKVVLNFSLVSKPALILAKESIIERSENEREVLGFYLSKHPILDIKKKNNIDVESLIFLKHKQGFVKGFGLINRVRIHRSKKGMMMCFLLLSDESGDLDMIIMPSLYLRTSHLYKKGNYIYFDAKITEDKSCICQNVTLFDKENHNG